MNCWLKLIFRSQSIYNPKQWSEESYYENLSKVQREEMDRREKERRDRTKVIHLQPCFARCRMLALFL